MLFSIVAIQSEIFSSFSNFVSKKKYKIFSSWTKM
jgi:hypothetical protein